MVYANTNAAHDCRTLRRPGRVSSREKTGDGSFRFRPTKNAMESDEELPRNTDGGDDITTTKHAHTRRCTQARSRSAINAICVRRFSRTKPNMFYFHEQRVYPASARDIVGPNINYRRAVTLVVVPFGLLLRRRRRRRRGDTTIECFLFHARAPPPTPRCPPRQVTCGATRPHTPDTRVIITSRPRRRRPHPQPSGPVSRTCSRP